MSWRPCYTRRSALRKSYFSSYASVLSLENGSTLGRKTFCAPIPLVSWVNCLFFPFPVELARFLFLSYSPIVTSPEEKSWFPVFLSSLKERAAPGGELVDPADGCWLTPRGRLIGRLELPSRDELRPLPSLEELKAKVGRANSNSRKQEARVRFAS